MAKLYGNKSAAFYQLALAAESEEADSEVTSEFLQRALNDGLKSVELDVSYEKGHFRLVSSAMLIIIIIIIIIINTFITHHVCLQKAAKALVRWVRRSGDSN